VIPEIIAEFGQVFAFARARWARFAEQVHPELRGPDMLMLQMISRKGPITATELGQLLFMDKALVSRQTSKLRQLGLVDAASDEADRRVVLLTASDRAKGMLGELHDQLSEAYEQRLAGWSAEDLATLRSLLHRFNAAAHAPELDGPAARCSRRSAAAGDERPAGD
jgi:DNA-binding MarR family transcriptional regulator